MRKITFLLIVAVTFMFSFNLMAKDSEKKFDLEKVFEKVSTKKYKILEEKVKLTDEQKKRILPILKKYDKLAFDSKKDHFQKRKTMKAYKEKGDYKSILEHMKKGLDNHKKFIKLQSKKIDELERSGVSEEAIVKVLHFERRFMKRVMKRFMKRRGEGMGLGQNYRDGKGDGFREGRKGKRRGSYHDGRRGKRRGDGNREGRRGNRRGGDFGDDLFE